MTIPDRAPAEDGRTTRRLDQRLRVPRAFTRLGNTAVVAIAAYACLAAASATGPRASVVGAQPRSRSTTTITIDGAASGRRFDGVGAISGGGATSRYLIDYPRPARDAILDYLFAPNYGAALQILKVEIGGDANSTDGSEPSIEHTPGDIDCNAGYQFWLMEEAKARHPAIQLYALAWAAPGWVGRFWSHKTISYIIDWLRCARRHGLRIDYLGGNQNERPYHKAWTKALRTALDSAGFARTRIVMADAFDIPGKWWVAKDLAHDAALRSATSVMGHHDMCGYPTDGYRCRSTRIARRLGKPLWATELGGMDGNTGAAAMARSMIRGYPQARLSAYITWPLISAMPDGLPHDRYGLIYARQPWSGHYDVNAMTYAIAMMTWFTSPGWRYVNTASGALRGAYANGGYTTLRSPNGRDWTTVAETTTSTATRRAAFRIGRRLAATTVHVWRTDPNSRNAADWMVRARDLHPAKRRFSFRLRPGYLYTFTTVARRPKPKQGSPPPRGLGGYVDRPGANPLDEAPVELASMEGTFRYWPCRDDPVSRCTQQMAPQPPVYWWPDRAFPYAVLGEQSLRDYTISSDVLFTGRSASGGVIARFSHRRARTSSRFRGYILSLDDTGTWRLLKNDPTRGADVLGSGALGAPAGVGRWHALALTVNGSRLTAAIDGRQVVSTVDDDSNYATGIAGIEAGACQNRGAWTGTSWPIVQYRHLRLTP